MPEEMKEANMAPRQTAPSTHTPRANASIGGAARIE
jgi:hypothetical protein